MTTKSDVSPGNWAALVAAGPAIARAVSASAGSTDRSEAELGAYVQFVSDAATGASGGDVLGQLVADVANLLAVGVEPVAGDAFSEGLEQARHAGAILAVELEPGEATAVRGWYLAAARSVAEAAREGGVFGIGASDVSTWERETIQSIADALGAGGSSS